MAVRAWGVRIGIRSNNPEILAEVAQYLPPGWKASGSPVVDRLYSLVVGGSDVRPGVRRFNLLYGDWDRLARTRELSEVFTTLERDAQVFVAEAARRLVFVHAGVVGWRDRAIVMPGRTHTGKTTLVVALVRAGATYYSDEYAVFDPRGRVYPFPRRLGLRGSGGEPSVRVDIETIGGYTGTRPVPVGMVLVTEFRDGVRWRPRPLSPGQAAMALMNNTVAIRAQPAATLVALQGSLASRPLLIKGARGDAEAIAANILQQLDDAR